MDLQGRGATHRSEHRTEASWIPVCMPVPNASAQDAQPTPTQVMTQISVAKEVFTEGGQEDPQ